MTFSDMILENIQSGQGTAVIQSGVVPAKKYSAKSEDTVFGKILDRKLNHTSERQTNVNKTNVKLKESQSPEPKFLTFSEANNGNVNAAASNLRGMKNAKSDGIGDRLPESDKDAEKLPAGDGQTEIQQYSMLCVFSQLLGISVNDLQKILKESGISVEAFNKMENISEISSRLSQILELDKTQQDVLVKMLRLTSDTLDICSTAENEPVAAVEEGLTEDTKQQAGITQEDCIATDPLPVEMKEGQVLRIYSSDSEILTSDLESSIKLKLNELGKRLETDKESIESELKGLIQLIPVKTEVKVQEPQKQAQVTSNEEDFKQTASVNDKNAEAPVSKDDKPNPDSYGRSDKKTETSQPGAMIDETQQQAVFAVVHTDVTNEANILTATTEKIQADAPINAKEVIGQVIEKAKVILTPEKSEMIMDLKPDSLGKISLKVITENSIVMAKFVAENQQIRQVLESNMQLLKDSLERQGMNVQGFSVSVRQDSGQSAGNWAHPRKSSNRGIARVEYGNTFSGGTMEELMESSVTANPYNWGGSTINLTA